MFLTFFREAHPTGGTLDISSIIPNRTWSRRTRTLCSITFSSWERNYPSSGARARRERPPSTSNNTTSGAVRSFYKLYWKYEGLPVSLWKISIKQSTIIQERIRKKQVGSLSAAISFLPYFYSNGGVAALTLCKITPPGFTTGKDVLVLISVEMLMVLVWSLLF